MGSKKAKNSNSSNSKKKRVHWIELEKMNPTQLEHAKTECVCRSYSKSKFWSKWVKSQSQSAQITVPARRVWTVKVPTCGSKNGPIKRPSCIPINGWHTTYFYSSKLLLWIWPSSDGFEAKTSQHQIHSFTITPLFGSRYKSWN